MTPFQQFRTWLRKASSTEHVTTAVAGVVVVALFGWLVAPVHQGTAASRLELVTPTVLTTGGTAPIPAAGTGRTGSPPDAVGSAPGTTGPGVGSTSPAGASPGNAAPPGTRGSVATGPTGPTGPTGTTGAQPTTTPRCPTAGDPGVSNTKIDVAVTITDIVGASGNDAVGVPSPAEQQQDWQYVAGSINAAGGAACRQLDIHFYDVNPVNSNDAQQKCLQIAADNPFVVIDGGSLTDVGASDCLPAQRIPLISPFVTSDQMKKYYPYYLNPQGLQEDNYLNGYLGANQKGFLSAASGFKELGIIYQNCRPSVVAVGRAALRRAGVPDGQIVDYSLGCPPGRQSSPADFQQAVLAFKNAGVTHVTQLDDNDWPSFTRIAEQQNFKPRYVFADDTVSRATTGALAPDADNLDGAVNLLGRRLGEQNTPGYPPSAGTARCNAIFAKHGQQPVYQQTGGYGGGICNYLWFITKLLNQVPTLNRTELVPAMHSLGVFDSSFPIGPIDFSVMPAGSAYGRESWRVAQFAKSCSCWQVPDRIFHPPFS